MIMDKTWGKHLVLLLMLLLAACGGGLSPAEAPAVGTNVTDVEATSVLEPTGTPQVETVEPVATLQTPEVLATPSPTSTGRFVQFEETISEIGFTLPITIQHISGTSAWLFFELETAVAGEVFYWIDGREDLGVYSVEFGSDSTEHLIQLTDLLAATRYRVRVGLPTGAGNFAPPGLNGEAWGDILLHTYPEQPDHLRVSVIGDSGFGESITYALAAQMAAKQPDFVIHTGDIVYSAFENGTPLQAYQAKYFWPLQKVLLQAPLYAVPGNHEYYSDASIGDIAYYFYVFPPLQELVKDGSWIGAGQNFRNWFAVRLMDYQFLFLESQRFYRSEGTAEQTEWLRRNLDVHAGPTISTYHIATYTSGRHERDGLPIQQAWIPYFEQANVPLILSGHDHNYERLSIGDIEYIVSGGGSGKLYNLDQPLQGSQVFAAVSHFVQLDIYPDRIDIESINAFGDVIDKTTIAVE